MIIIISKLLWNKFIIHINNDMLYYMDYILILNVDQINLLKTIICQLININFK